MKKLLLVLMFIFSMAVFTGCFEEETPVKTPTLDFATKTFEVTVGDSFEVSPQIGELVGGIVEYSFDKEGIIEIQGTNGFKAVAAGEVKITASLKGYAEIKSEISVTVKEPVAPVIPPKTISEVIAAEDGNHVTRGVVVAISSRSFVIADNGAKILVYKGSNWTADIALGDKVKVEGATSVFGGAKQFGETATYEKIGTETFTEEAKEVDAFALDEMAAAESFKVEKVKILGTIAVSGNYINLVVEGATAKGSLAYVVNADEVKALDGKYVEVEGYAAYTSSKGAFVNIVVLGVTEKELPKVVVTEVYVGVGSISTFYAGKEYELDYLIEPEEATGYVFESSDATIATVDQEGKLTCLASGFVTITLKSTDDETISSEVTIKIIDLVSEITVTGQKEMDKGTTQRLAVTLLPATAVANAIFTSSDENILEVNGQGIVTAKEIGKAKIIVTSSDGSEAKAEFEITVPEPLKEVEEVLLDAKLATAEAGTKVTYADKEFVVGSSAFSTLKRALEAATKTVYVASGSYEGEVTVKKNNISIIGPNAGKAKGERTEEAVFNSKINVDKVENLFIDGVEFAGNGQVETVAEVKGVTIQYCHFNATSGDGLLRSSLTEYVRDVKFNYNFSDNYKANRVLHLSYVQNLEVLENYINSTGSYDFLNSQKIIEGKVVFKDNTYIHSNQSFIYAIGVKAIDCVIEGNYIENIASTIIDFRNMNDKNAEAKFDIKYNTFKASGTGWMPIRIRNAGYEATNKLTLVVAENKFIESFSGDAATPAFVNNPVSNGSVTQIYTIGKNYYVVGGKVLSKVEQANFGEAAITIDTPYANETDIIYGQEGEIYSVKFVVDGAEYLTSKVVENGKVGKPADPEKLGYKFVGWMLNDAAYDFETAVTTNIELVAKFEVDTTVQYDEVILDPSADEAVNSAKTIAQALKIAKDGATIKVKPGTYEGFVINKSVKLVSETAHEAIINGAVKVNANNVSFEGFKIIGKTQFVNEVEIDGLTISKCLLDSTEADGLVRNEKFKISNFTFTDNKGVNVKNARGFYFYLLENATVTGNDYTNNGLFDFFRVNTKATGKIVVNNNKIVNSNQSVIMIMGVGEIDFEYVGNYAENIKETVVDVRGMLDATASAKMLIKGNEMKLSGTGWRPIRIRNAGYVETNTLEINVVDNKFIDSYVLIETVPSFINNGLSNGTVTQIYTVGKNYYEISGVALTAVTEANFSGAAISFEQPYATLAEMEKIVLDPNAEEVGKTVKTMEKALELAKEGDTIYVKPGTYEGFVITKSVKLVSENEHEAIINGAVKVNANNVSFEGFKIIGSTQFVNEVEIDGLTITKCLIDGTEADGLVRNEKFKISNFTFTDNKGVNVKSARGFYFYLLENATVTGNDYTNNGLYDFFRVNTKATGKIVVNNNKIVNSNQSVIMIMGVGEIDFEYVGNYAENIKETVVDVRGMLDATATAKMLVKGNEMKESGKGWMPIRIRNAGYVETNTLEINVVDNKFIDSYYNDKLGPQFIENGKSNGTVTQIYTVGKNYYEISGVAVTAVTEAHFCGAAISFEQPYATAEEIK